MENPQSLSMAEMLAALEAAADAFRELSKLAGDSPEWNEGGVAYEASSEVNKAINKWTKQA